MKKIKYETARERAVRNYINNMTNVEWFNFYCWTTEKGGKLTTINITDKQN